MEERFAKIIRRVLKRQGVTAERALEALVAVMVDRHLDVELRRRGKREPYPIYNERADALKAVNDSLHQAKARGEGDAALVQGLMAMLIECQFAGEKAAGLDEDDEKDGPALRIAGD